MTKPSTSEALAVLYDEIDHRCQSVAEARPTWPCRRGCGHCCRHLAEPLRLGRAEWRRIEQGLDRLAPDVREEVEARFVEVARQKDGPLVCPFLDRDIDACRVYDHRPAACRTYGYYQSRDGGRFCHLVEAHVTGDNAIVWGSQEAVGRRLERLDGPPIALADWLDERPTTTSRSPGR